MVDLAKDLRHLLVRKCCMLQTILRDLRSHSFLAFWGQLIQKPTRFFTAQPVGHITSFLLPFCVNLSKIVIRRVPFFIIRHIRKILYQRWV